MLPTAIFSFGLSALFWLLIVRDVHTAMAWSNSFCLLSPSATEFVYWSALVLAGAGALLAVIRAVRIPRLRRLAIAVAVLNVLSPIAGHARWLSMSVTTLRQPSFNSSDDANPEIA